MSDDVVVVALSDLILLTNWRDACGSLTLVFGLVELLTGVRISDYHRVRDLGE